MHVDYADNSIQGGAKKVNLKTGDSNSTDIRLTITDILN